MIESSKTNRATKLVLVAAALFVMVGFFGISSPLIMQEAAAHKDPGTATTVGSGEEIGVFWDPALTQSVFLITDADVGSTVYVAGNLTRPSNSFAYEGGVVGIVLPNGTFVNVTPAGGVDCVGGTTVDTLSPATFPCTNQVAFEQTNVTEYVVDKADVAFGFFIFNLAYTGGHAHSGTNDSDLVTGSETRNIPFVSTLLTKTADAEKVLEGTPVTFTVNETNDGGADLFNVTVTDDQCDLTFVGGDTFSDNILSFGESWIYECTVIMNTTTTNTATATAELDDGTPITVQDDADESDSVTVTVISPAISLTKEADVEKVVGETEVTYTFNATNTGDTTLDNVTITDDQLGHIAGPVSLAPGASLVSQNSTIISANTTNTAEVIGFHQLGNVTDDATVTIRQLSAGVTLDKSVDQEKVINGTEVTYTYNATNTGTSTLFNVTITDDQLGHIAGPVSLAPGESLVVQNSTTITANTTNTAEVIGFFQLANVTDSDSAFVRVINPSIDVEKSCTPEAQTEPGTITWTIVITNTGDIELQNVTAVDTINGTLIDILDSVTLAPGENVTIQYVSSNLTAGNYTNTVNVTGQHQLGTVEDSDVATCEVEAAGFEGCTPGFWKENAENWNAVAWPDAYEPSDEFFDVFGVHITVKVGKQSITDPTLLEALNAQGGGINALARHAVAALLNSAQDFVEYPMTTAEVIDAVQDAVNSGDKNLIESTKSEFAENNELGCGVDQHGNEIEPETT
jgi:uncharacterized repeat protein (TIGR01451 family)